MVACWACSWTPACAPRNAHTDTSAGLCLLRSYPDVPSRQAQQSLAYERQRAVSKVHSHDAQRCGRGEPGAEATRSCNLTLSSSSTGAGTACSPAHLARCILHLARALQVAACQRAHGLHASKAAGAGLTPIALGELHLMAGQHALQAVPDAHHAARQNGHACQTPPHLRAWSGEGRQADCGVN